MDRAEVARLFAPAHTAMLVVDVQHAFASEGGLVHRLGHDLRASRAIIPPLQRLLAAARRAGVRVIFLRVSDSPNGQAVSDVELARRRRIGLPDNALPDGSWDAEIIPDLAPLSGEPVITKHRLCGFVGTSLDLVLRAGGIRSVIVAGLQSHACVLSTAWLAGMHDYFVAVPEDCTASPRTDLHDAAMALMRHSLHAVLASEDLIAVWERADTRREPDGSWKIAAAATTQGPTSSP